MTRFFTVRYSKLRMRRTTIEMVAGAAMLRSYRGQRGGGGDGGRVRSCRCGGGGTAERRGGRDEFYATSFESVALVSGPLRRARTSVYTPPLETCHRARLTSLLCSWLLRRSSVRVAIHGEAAPPPRRASPRLRHTARGALYALGDVLMRLTLCWQPR